MTAEIQTPEIQSPETEGQQAVARVYRPAVDVAENKDELLIVADLPGAKSDSIDIHFEDGVLTLAATVTPRELSEGRWLAREYGVGNYQRTFHVGDQVDGNRIRADFVAGVLTIHLPRNEAAKPRKISVNAGA